MGELYSNSPFAILSSCNVYHPEFLLFPRVPVFDQDGLAFLHGGAQREQTTVGTYRNSVCKFTEVFAQLVPPKDPNRH